jgi:hypothetical protein
MKPKKPIESLILNLRGQKVILDADLAELYDVPTKVFNQAVKRNRSRFPEDFMFPLSRPEFENWRSHFVISNPEAKMGLRRRPYAFTEQGVAMLSSVLRSERAVMAAHEAAVALTGSTISAAAVAQATALAGPLAIIAATIEAA